MASGEASLGGTPWTETEAKGTVNANVLGHWQSQGLRNRNVHFVLSGTTLRRFGVKICGLKLPAHLVVVFELT